MKIKIKYILPLQIAIIFLLSFKITHNLSIKKISEKNISTLSKNNDQEEKLSLNETSFTVLNELFRALKKPNNENSDEYKSCLDLVISNKYAEYLTTIWNTLHKIACNSKEKIKRGYFINFIKETTEEININQIETECKDIIKSNILKEEDIDEPKKQTKLKRIFASQFTCPTNSSQIDFITSYASIHRDARGPDMFRILNQGANGNRMS